MKRLAIKKKVFLVTFGIFLSFILLEIGLRMGGFIFLSLQEYRNTASIKQKGEYVILCIGESTTASGGNNSYPRQLEEVLNKAGVGIKFSVINKGIPGTSSSVIVSQLESSINKYKPDMIIAMMGINDSPGIVPYHDLLSKKKTSLSFLRTYKLAKLLKAHLLDNVKRKQEDTFSLGRMNMFQGDFSKATENFRKVIENPEKADSSEAYRKLGQSHLLCGDHVMAEKMFRKSIDIDPLNAAAYIGLGECFRTNQMYGHAEKMFEKAIAIREDVWAYINLGYCLMKQEKYNRAQEIYKKAMEISPKDTRIYGALALCYLKQKDYKSADQYLKQAEKLQMEYYNVETKASYDRLKTITTRKNIKLVCVEYPTRSVEPLKKIFDANDDIIFVDNGELFVEAVKREGYDTYFTDSFAGSFGHCTAKGNRLLAENVANEILKESLF
ncbi:MAG: tetratricopeptide repeat protein [Candidatus Omnitrophica bacterium]|nr:tetratricopeptide repeat protein [Candidatus Omnitrophota bacterium]